MLLGKNPEFFRQKEKSVGFIKPVEGGDGGYHERGSSTSPGVPLPGLRAVNSSAYELTLDQGQNVPYNDISE
jgi:hypothetical protein